MEEAKEKKNICGVVHSVGGGVLVMTAREETVVANVILVVVIVDRMGCSYSTNVHGVHDVTVTVKEVTTVS